MRCHSWPTWANILFSMLWTSSRRYQSEARTSEMGWISSSAARGAVRRAPLERRFGARRADRRGSHGAKSNFDFPENLSFQARTGSDRDRGDVEPGAGAVLVELPGEARRRQRHLHRGEQLGRLAARAARPE